jgi:predicted permease
MGLATAAGLNAYIPLLVIGLLGRYTNLIELPSSWAWLDNGWVIAILIGLLAIEFVADKIPAIDSVNDVVQTFVRPTAGGLAFAAGSGSETVMVKNPGDLFTQKMWIPIVIGLLIALTVHGAKATVRPVANVATVGLAAPVVSTAEDVTSTGLSLTAIIIPILVIVLLILMIWLFVRWRRRRKQRWRGQPALVEQYRRY